MGLANSLENTLLQKTQNSPAVDLGLSNKKCLIYFDANPFDVSGYVNKHIGPHILQLSNTEQSGATLSHTKLGNVSLCRIRYGGQARVISEGLPDFYHVQFILSGQCSYTIAQEAITLSTGQILVINPNEAIDLTYSEDCEKFIMNIPVDLLNEVCLENHWLNPDKCVKFKQTPYEFAEVETLLNLVTLLCNEAEGQILPPQILHHYSRVVTGKLMTMLKHNVALSPPTIQSASFERIVKYVESNIKREISVDELAQHAYMSLRSLYLVFEKFAGTTPKNFIRQKKLEHVHATLLNPANKVLNVTAVAMDYGFTHLGRFSENYKSAFGKLPSDTLRENLSKISFPSGVLHKASKS